MTTLPTHADIVIIGGGVIGLATAYHLAKANAGSIVLIDSGAFGSGSTSKAAGGVRAQFSDEANIIMGLHSLEVFEHFKERFDQEIDLVQTGYLFLLDSDDDLAEFERSVALQRSLGVDSNIIDVATAKRLSPLINTDGLVGAAYAARDGYCTPESVVLGYARAARRAGATLIPHCAATGADLVDGEIRAIHTAVGRIETSTVICAAGAWSREVGAWFDVDLPVDPLRRQILITEPMPQLDRSMAMTIDFSTSFYFHPEGQGLLVGMSDPDETYGFKLHRGDEWLPRLAEAIDRRAPAVAELGMTSGWAGLYETTPDNNGLIGEAQHVGRFIYATGFSGHGFLLAPAIGEVLTSLVRGEEPFVDVSAFDAKRFAHAMLLPEKNIV